MDSPILGNLKIEFSKYSGKKKSLILSQILLKYISSGKLMIGQRLPSSRKLAEKLQVNRTTVIKSYEELEQQGWIKSKVGSGYYIQNICDTEIPQKGMDNNGSVDIEELILNSKKFSDINKLSIPPIVPRLGLHLDDGFPDPKLSFL